MSGLFWVEYIWMQIRLNHEVVGKIDFSEVVEVMLSSLLSFIRQGFH